MSNWRDKFINKIVCGDCLELMRELPENCVDLVLTDPPYGIKQNAHRVKSRTKAAKTTDWGDFDWDANIPSAEVFSHLLRISKQQIIWGGNYFIEYLTRSPCWLVWDKDNSGCFADCELAWSSFKTAVRIFKYRWNSMIQENMVNKEVRFHPTQKPIKLGIWCLENYSEPDQIILDMYSGSGSFCVAAKMLGRNYIGIDISEEYCKIARMRIKAVETGVPVKEQLKGQMGLFES